MSQEKGRTETSKLISYTTEQWEGHRQQMAKMGLNKQGCRETYGNNKGAAGMADYSLGLPWGQHGSYGTTYD